MNVIVFVVFIVICHVFYCVFIVICHVFYLCPLSAFWGSRDNVCGAATLAVSRLPAVLTEAEQYIMGLGLRAYDAGLMGTAPMFPVRGSGHSARVSP